MVESSKNQQLKESKENLAKAQVAIGAAISLYLSANNETMQKLAKNTGINPSMLTGYRRGDPTRDKAPSLENLIRIKNGLDISYDQLLGVNDNNDLNGNLNEALDNSSYYTDGDKQLPLNKVQKDTIKRLVYAYLNITDNAPAVFQQAIDDAVERMLKKRDKNG